MCIDVLYVSCENRVLWAMPISIWLDRPRNLGCWQR
ncbi:hypothetical protein GGD41_006014 [Paraburkholderia bryophila]|uniref:Uncharacterized protein n=1 Tax=Paraburkholderia bryophila TaxID=420952 RepID=A0A7Z0B2B1_9BURK|nr:hypothetical protein [Paraburkholderia bryophila]